MSDAKLTLACGCHVMMLGEHLHTVGCTPRHEAQLDALWSKWCGERGIAYHVAPTALS